ncbi:MAG: SDR family NAD(P)-dependent oxidoreductase [Melioribacteraceae bacterium]|jgi:3-oxoacyl-[acyl-carrier protein] reductase|nr:SDR family NAD(P)-dependent oxidoreductase [Melioribacteraceae bacterium]
MTVTKKDTVWITGASSGIGKSLVKKFTSNNIHVTATSRRLNELEKLKNEINNLDLISIERVDMSSRTSIEMMISNFSDKFNFVGLINNAGITSFSKAADDSVEKIEEIINTNLLGAIYAIKSVLQDMLNSKNGTIINILSVVTKRIFTASSAYSASKNGLLAYTNVLREELRENNIRIINISPGATATPIWPEKVLSSKISKMMNADDIADLIFTLYKNKSNLVAEDITIRPISGDL